MLIPLVFYCHKLNLFSDQPHQESCCTFATIDVPKTRYSERSWFPTEKKGIQPEEKIKFTINGYHWFSWEKECRLTYPEETAAIETPEIETPEIETPIVHIRRYPKLF